MIRRNSPFAPKVFTLLNCVGGRDARPAPAPGEMAAPGRPGPENFQLCPAPPRPGKRGRCPAPPRKLPWGKNRGKRSYIIKSFWESKTFDQYF